MVYQRYMVYQGLLVSWSDKMVRKLVQHAKSGDKYVVEFDALGVARFMSDSLSQTDVDVLLAGSLDDAECDDSADWYKHVWEQADSRGEVGWREL